MERACSAQGRSCSARSLGGGVLLLVVSFTFLTWSLRAAFLHLDPLSSLTAEGLLNEVVRLAVFVGPVLLYLRYVEKAPSLEFLRLGAPRKNSAWVLPLVGSLFFGWHLLLDRVVGDGIVNGATPAVVLFTIRSPATLIEEIYFRGFLLNKFWQTAGFWQANFFSSLLFGLIHLPGWFVISRFVTPFVAVDLVGLVVFGMVFGWAMKKTGSLWSAYLLHTLYNLLVVNVLGS